MTRAERIAAAERAFLSAAEAVATWKAVPYNPAADINALYKREAEMVAALQALRAAREPTAEDIAEEIVDYWRGSIEGSAQIALTEAIADALAKAGVPRRTP